jgi:hypothetical protein
MFVIRENIMKRPVLSRQNVEFVIVKLLLGTVKIKVKVFL